MNTFRLNIVTPERRVLSVQVEMVNLCLPDGEYVLLAEHEPVTCALTDGLVQYRTEAGETHELLVSEGFAEMRPDRAVIFTAQCLDADNLDRAQEKAEMQRMREQRLYEESLLQHHSASLFIARTMSASAKRRRRRGG